jgi:hypothetical protein
VDAIPTASALVPLCLRAVFSCRSQKGCGKGTHALQLLLLCKAQFLSAAFSSGCRITLGVMAMPMQSQDPCSLQTNTEIDAGRSVEELQSNGTASHYLQKAVQMILRKLRSSGLHPLAADLHAAQLAPKQLLALSGLTRLAHPAAKSCSMMADRQRLAGPDPVTGLGVGRTKISPGLREAAAEQHALLHGVGRPQMPSR